MLWIFNVAQKPIIGIYPRSTRTTRIIGLFSLSHEQNKARFNYAVARKQRRSQFRRNLDGFYWVASQEILEEIFFKMLLTQEIIYHSDRQLQHNL